MSGKQRSDLPKWLRSKSTGEKAFKNVHAAGQVFMLEFRVSYPADIPRAHVALLFDFSGSCQVGSDGHLRTIAGTLAHVVVNDVKTRETHLELKHVSSVDHSSFLDPTSINRVYLLGRLTSHMNHPKDFFDSVAATLKDVYQSLVESDESLSEGEVSVVKRSEYEEKRYYRRPERRSHSRQPTPSMSLTDSGSVVWRVSSAKGEEVWVTKEEMKEKPKPLKDSTQSVILTYGPTQREEIRKSGFPKAMISSDDPSSGAKLPFEGLTQSSSEEDLNHIHGPYWDNQLNCLTFCKAVCHHWPELAWPSEGLCAPILWPLPSLTVHFTMGYPTPAPATSYQSNSASKTGPNGPFSSHEGNPPLSVDPSQAHLRDQVPPTREKKGIISRVISSLKRRIRAILRRLH
jgi:hypothetical protein